MNRSARGAVILFGLAACLVAAHAQQPVAKPAAVEARAIAVPDWPIGARADRDVVTPIELVVQDPEETQLLQDRAAARVALIYRLDMSAPSEAAKRLERAFFEAREAFRRSATSQFIKYPVPGWALEGDTFARWQADWTSRWNGFPPSAKLATAWASGDTGRDDLTALTELLTTYVSQRRIRESTVEPDSGLGQPDVRLVAVEGPETPLTMAEVGKAAVPFPRTEFIPLAKARLELQAQVPDDERLGKFLASLLEPNSLYEEALTREERRQLVGSISSLDRYRAGQAIIHKGEVVSPAVRAALDQLRTVSPEGIAVIETLPETAPAPTVIVQQESQPWYGGPGTLIAVSILTLALAILFLARRVRHTHQVVQHSTALTVMQAERGAAPEANPERAQIIERALRDAAVQSLYGQRQQLVTENRQATEKLQDLEARISRLQPQIRAKLKAYEERISELEHELEGVRDENRELLREQIEDTRRERDEFIADLA